MPIFEYQCTQCGTTFEQFTQRAKEGRFLRVRGAVPNGRSGFSRALPGRQRRGADADRHPAAGRVRGLSPGPGAPEREVSTILVPAGIWRDK